MADEWVPLRRYARDSGIDRQALTRWLREGKVRGRQGENGYWEIVPSTVTPDVVDEYRRRRGAVAKGLTGSPGVDLAAEVADQRKMIADLMAANREKDQIIADLVSQLRK